MASTQDAMETLTYIQHIHTDIYVYTVYMKMHGEETKRNE